MWGTQQYFSHRHRRRPKSCLSTQTMFQMWRYGTFGTSTLGISKRKSGPIYISLFDLRQLFKEKREHPWLTELQLRGNPFKGSQQFYKKDRFLFVSQCLKKEHKFWVEKGRKSARKYILGFFLSYFALDRYRPQRSVFFIFQLRVK